MRKPNTGRRQILSVLRLDEYAGEEQPNRPVRISGSSDAVRPATAAAATTAAAAAKLFTASFVEQHVRASRVYSFVLLPSARLDILDLGLAGSQQEKRRPQGLRDRGHNHKRSVHGDHAYSRYHRLVGSAYGSFDISVLLLPLNNETIKNIDLNRVIEKTLW